MALCRKFPLRCVNLIPTLRSFVTNNTINESLKHNGPSGKMRKKENNTTDLSHANSIDNGLQNRGSGKKSVGRRKITKELVDADDEMLKVAPDEIVASEHETVDKFIAESKESVSEVDSSGKYGQEILKPEESDSFDLDTLIPDVDDASESHLVASNNFESVTSRKRSFHSLGLPTFWKPILKELNISYPTDIQINVIPELLCEYGPDLNIHGETGSGKTLSYLLPILTHINWEIDEMQALVVLPTRELVLQVGSLVHKLLMQDSPPEGISGDSEETPYALLYADSDPNFLTQNLQNFVNKPCPIVISTPNALLRLLTDDSLMSKSLRNQVNSFWYAQDRKAETNRIKSTDTSFFTDYRRRQKHTKVLQTLGILSRKEIENKNVTLGLDFNISMVPGNISYEARHAPRVMQVDNKAIEGYRSFTALPTSTSLVVSGNGFSAPSIVVKNPIPNPISLSSGLILRKDAADPENFPVASFAANSTFYAPYEKLNSDALANLARAHALSLTTNTDILHGLRWLVLDEADTLLQPLARRACLKDRKAKIRHPTSAESVLQRLLACYSAYLSPSPFISDDKQALNNNLPGIRTFRIVSVSATMNKPLRSYLMRARQIIGSKSSTIARTIRPDDHLNFQFTKRPVEIADADMDKLFPVESNESAIFDTTNTLGESSEESDPKLYLSPKLLLHKFIVCDENLKIRQLAYLARTYYDSNKKRCGILAILPDTAPMDVILKALRSSGLLVESLHSQMSPLPGTWNSVKNSGALSLPTYENRNEQAVEKSSLENISDFLLKMKSGDIDIVLCTQATARGIDIPYLKMVCLLYAPTITSDYLHFAGRVCRQTDQHGIAVSIVTEGEIEILRRHSARLQVDFNAWNWPINDANLVKKKDIEEMIMNSKEHQVIQKDINSLFPDSEGIELGDVKHRSFEMDFSVPTGANRIYPKISNYQLRLQQQIKVSQKKERKLIVENAKLQAPQTKKTTKFSKPFKSIIPLKTKNNVSAL